MHYCELKAFINDFFYPFFAKVSYYFPITETGCLRIFSLLLDLKKLSKLDLLMKGSPGVKI